jgi:hypothetical protein
VRAALGESISHYGRCAGHLQQTRFHAALFEHGGHCRGVAADVGPVTGQVRNGEQVEELGEYGLLVRRAPLMRCRGGRVRLGVREGGERHR